MQKVKNRKFLLVLFLVFVAVLTNAQCILINEIMINPTGPNDGSGMPNTSEWVELYNSCPDPVDIGCYVINDGDFTITIPAGTIMPGNSYFTLGSVNSGVPLDLNWGTCGCTTAPSQIGIFSNNGEQLALVDANGNLSDGIYWGAGQFPINNNNGPNPPAGCSIQSFNFPNAGSNFEQIPVTVQQGCTISRLCNGTWGETCGSEVTPDAANGAVTAVVDFSASNTNICAGDCIDFQDLSTGATSWTWTFNGASIANSNSENPLSVCYDTPGTFDVQLDITSACGPSTLLYPDFITVNASDIPVIAANGPLTFCDGNSVILNCTSIGTFQWYNNGIAIAGATQNSYTVADSGSYTVETNNNSCINTSTATILNVITVTTPVITPSGPISLCEGQDTLLSVNAIYDSYQWLSDGVAIPGANATSYTASVTAAYSVLVTSGNCEVTSNSAVVNVYPIPVVHVDPNGPVDGCEGDPINLQTIQNFDSYQWLMNGSIIGSATSNLYNATATGSYSLEVTANICSGISDAINITFHATPDVSISPDSDIHSCESSALLTAQTNGDIQWYINNTILPGEVSPNLLVTSNGEYKFSSSLNGFCNTFSESITVNLNIPLTVVIDASADTACVGDIVQLHALGDFQNVLWSNSQTTTSIQVSQNGDYYVTAFSGTCIAMDTASVYFSEYPEVNAGDNFSSDCGAFLTLNGNSTGISFWEVNNTAIGAGDTITINTPKTTTDYTLVSRLNQCYVRDSVTVHVDCVFLFVPNSFTPDNDGINDVFRVYSKGIAHYYLRIFNRWGEVLFETDDPDKVWTGGSPDYYVPDGIYIWQIEALDYNLNPVLDDKNSTGTITILR